MNKYLLFSLTLGLCFARSFGQDTLIIQETELGFCSCDGTIKTDLSGWTGPGYIDVNPGIDASISWQIDVAAEGDYSLVWRYAFAGNKTPPRDARLVIDDITVTDTIYFPYTDTTGTLKWTSWSFSPPDTVHLLAGSHKIRIEAHYSSGLGNYDYLMVIGSGVTPTVCIPEYVVNVKSNDTLRGTVSYEPIQRYYSQGTLVTMKAYANPGYFFQCWTGEPTSADTAYTFPITSNVNAVARFLPNSTKLDSSIIGYATVEDDSGTSYWAIGGALGDSVTATTVAELQTFLGDTLPRMVKFSGWLVGTEQISIKSDKTLLGVGDTAHLEGIGISINQAQNVIIRNISIAHVCTTGAASGDAIEINGASKNIVIDHCELSSDRDHDKDYYDGLLDIKNQSSFITVSWTVFHDHYKVSLISSGDEQTADTVIRVTYHHNLFYHCGSRLPSIRFGRAHIFNNYYLNSDDAVNSRMNAWVRVERNYFENVGTAVTTAYSAVVGSVQLIDNHFGSSSVTTSPTCDLRVPYAFTSFLDSTERVPDIVTRGVHTTSDVQKAEISAPIKFQLNQNFPNPFNPKTVISYQLPVKGRVILKVYDLLGREVTVLVNEEKSPGSYTLEWNAENLPSGIYYYRLSADGYTQVKKMVLIK